jgi:hypothetical protein
MRTLQSNKDKMNAKIAWLYFLARQGRGLRGSVGQESEKTGPVPWHVMHAMQQLSLEQAVPKRVSVVGRVVPSPYHDLAFCLQKTSQHIDCVIKNPFWSNLNWLLWTLYGYYCLEIRKLLPICSGALIFCARVGIPCIVVLTKQNDNPWLCLECEKTREKV